MALSLLLNEIFLFCLTVVSYSWALVQAREFPQLGDLTGVGHNKFDLAETELKDLAFLA